jgi:hypothetical protein
MNSSNACSFTRTTVARTARCRILAAATGLSMVAMVAGGLLADDASGVLRVESEVFVEGDTEPVARSLALFRNGVVWDFWDPAAVDDAAEDDAPRGTIVLHDPARERVVLVDVDRNVKTEVDTLRLERLGVSLASWARRSDDRLIRWAGGPDFGDGFKERDSRLELVGPRARYEVDHAAAPSPESAILYGKFADTAILLKALLHPGGIPPFPRLAINRRVAAAGGIPSVVRLEIDPRMAVLASRPDRLRSVHKVHPRLLAGDLGRIEEAEARVAVAETVGLAIFVEPPPPRPAEEAKPAGDGGSATVRPNPSES